MTAKDCYSTISQALVISGHVFFSEDLLDMNYAHYQGKTDQEVPAINLPKM